MKYNDTKNRIFDFTIAAITMVLVIICIVPLVNMLAVSFSSNAAIMANKVLLWPVEWSFYAYMAVFKDAIMIRSLFFTVILTVAFTALSMFMTILCAYPLTKKNLKGRNVFLFLIVITMYFSGGMIPDYILVKSLGILNTVWCLLLPTMLSAFNMIILKTFFSNLPESLEESAFLDGASHATILFRIVLPLSTPVLATLSLFYAVGRWNGFQDALLYISDPKLYTLQLKLYQIVYNSMSLEVSQVEGSWAGDLIPESMRAASVMFATVPILLVYPWLQRYFISGVMMPKVSIK